MTTRDEHLAWCKQRALEYVAHGDLPGAWTSFASDMGKHDETRGHHALRLGAMMMLNGHLDTAYDMGKFIKDFT